MYFHGVEEVVVVDGAVVVTVMPVALARRRSQRGRAFATFAGSVPVRTSRCRRDRYEWRDLPPTVAPPERPSPARVSPHLPSAFRTTSADTRPASGGPPSRRAISEAVVPVASSLDDPATAAHALADSGRGSTARVSSRVGRWRGGGAIVCTSKRPPSLAHMIGGSARA